MSLKTRAFLCSYASLFVVSLADNLKGAIYPDFLQAFALETPTGSLIFFFTAFGTWLANASGRFWLPRLKTSVWVYKAFMVLLLISLIGASFGLRQPHGWVWLIVFCSLMGMTFGGLSVAQHSLIAEFVPKERVLKAYSSLHVMYGAAAFLAPQFVVLLKKMNLSWMDSFWTLAVVPLLLLILATGLESQQELTPPKKEKSLWEGVDRKKALLIGLVLAFYVACEIAIGSRIVLLARREWGWGEVNAGYLMSFFFFCLLLGRVGLTFFRLPFRTVPLLRGSAMASALLILAGLEGYPLMIGLAGFTLSPFFPATMSLITEEFPDRVGLVTSQSMALVAGALMIMHYLVGWITRYWGVVSALKLGVVLMGLCFILLILIKSDPGDSSESPSSSKVEV